MIQILLRFSLATTEGLLNTSPPLIRRTVVTSATSTSFTYKLPAAKCHTTPKKCKSEADRTQTLAEPQQELPFFMFEVNVKVEQAPRQKTLRLNNVIHWYNILKKYSNRTLKNKTQGGPIITLSVGTTVDYVSITETIKNLNPVIQSLN